MIKITPLPERGVIAVEGEDRVAFLQGLVSNDVEAAEPGRAVWAALLTPAGQMAGGFLHLRGSQPAAAGLRERAGRDAAAAAGPRYRLRMKVALRAEPELTVSVAWGGAAGRCWDRCARSPVAGLRVAHPCWHRRWRQRHHRKTGTVIGLQAGVPDGSRDLEADRSVLLEAGFDELGGVSWSKGCYMGQELTARTKYRGLIKRRLVPVAVEGPLPPSGTPVFEGRSGSRHDAVGTRTILGLRRCGSMPWVACFGAARRLLTVRVPELDAPARLAQAVSASEA